MFSNLSMDTLDYTGPEVNKGSKGVWLGLGDPVRDLPREFRPAAPLPRGVSGVRGLLRRAASSSAAPPGATSPTPRRASPATRRSRAGRSSC